MTKNPETDNIVAARDMGKTPCRVYDGQKPSRVNEECVSVERGFPTQMNNTLEESDPSMKKSKANTYQ
jgi:hypothetical protein